MPRDPEYLDFPVRPTTARATERLWLNYHRLVEEHDQLCNRNLRLQVDVRKLSKACGRYLQRIVELERRASQAEVALAHATHRPAMVIKAILRIRRLLLHLSAPRCRSCLMGDQVGHRYNCRIQSALRMISDLLASLVIVSSVTA